MNLTASDLARLGPAAQKQVVEKVLAQKTGKYHNRKTVRHGITFDSKQRQIATMSCGCFWMRGKYTI